MQTKIFPISATSPDAKIIKNAARIIKNGGLVAFPTETVYGLGANALDSAAAKKIFIAKNRPADNPLIIHIAERKDLTDIAAAVPDSAWKLADAFWPGPLTIVLPKQKNIPFIVSGGLDTVAVRMPNHAVALALIKASGVPIAAPSANTATRPSPTAARHVYDDLAEKIDCILDAGGVSIGIESTVIDLTSSLPAILRPGAVTAEMLSPYLPNFPNLPHTPQFPNFLTVPRSPGTKYTHYAPSCAVFLFTGDLAQEKIASAYKKVTLQGKKCLVICQTAIEDIPLANQRILTDASAYARSIFSLFREAEKQHVACILIERVEETGLGHAVMNRLRKAATKII